MTMPSVVFAEVCDHYGSVVTAVITMINSHSNGTSHTSGHKIVTAQGLAYTAEKCRDKASHQ